MNDQSTHGSWAASGRVAVMAGMLSLVLAVPAPASTTNDAWITTKVKMSLLTTEGVSSNVVNVDTVNQQVTLHGTVNSAEEKQKAESAAKSVAGVKSVRNLLQVVAEKREAAVERNDSEITTQVTFALERESSLQDSSIKVQSVNKGVVLLAGDAKNLTDHLTAVKVARSVPGVRRVASEIQSPDALADSDMWRAGDTASAEKPAAKNPDTSARIEGKAEEIEAKGERVGDKVERKGEEIAAKAEDKGEGAVDKMKDAAGATTGAASDLYITSMVKMRLLADSDTPAMDINVDCDDGVVTLFGEVPTKQAKAAAETDARKVGGVKSVKNELQVVASADKPRVEAKDEEIRTNVEKNLQSRTDLKDVNADVKNCVVRLTGTVPSGVERVEAMQVARSTRGVCSVQEDLRFKEY